MSRAPRQPARAPASLGTPSEGMTIEDMAADLPTPDVTPVRTAERQAVKLGPGQFLGRNGEVLELKRKPDQNLFDIPPHLLDPEYTYEWKRYQVYGKPDTTHQVSLAENGWRPVMVEPGSPFAGYYMPADYRGPIQREDLMLMERPKGLTDMVRHDERERARRQMVDNHRRYTSGQGVEVPRGFGTAQQNANVPAQISTSYEAGLPQAKHLPIE